MVWKLFSLITEHRLPGTSQNGSPASLLALLKIFYWLLFTNFSL